MASRRRSLSRGREREFIAAEEYGRPVQNLGVLSEEDDRMRKKAYKAVKHGLQSYQEHHNTDINVLPVGEWDVDKKTNFVHIPFKIATFPACGAFEKYFRKFFSDKRCVIEYDGSDRFILKLDWKRLLNSEVDPYSFIRQHKREVMSAFFLVLALWFWFIWSSLGRSNKE